MKDFLAQNVSSAHVEKASSVSPKKTRLYFLLRKQEAIGLEWSGDQGSDQ